MDLKEKGNEAFKAGNMEDAIVLFTEAISQDESNSVLFNNRAMAFAGLERWEECVMDAREAVQLNATYSKAYYRLVKGLMQLNRIREARQYMLVAYQSCESDTHKDFKALDTELETLSECPLRPKPGDFDIVDEIGDGNFSKIYKASLKSNKKVFAIKVIEVQTVERMKRRHRNINNEIMMEKKVLTKLNHPNVVTLYSTFKDFGSLYYQMEFLPGGELWSLLKDDDAALHGDNGEGGACLVGLPRSRARFLIMEAINALEYMHKCGIVHRDIKPENMLLTTTGHLKLVDFGTAKDLLDTTLNGPEFVGTPEYMAPSAINSIVSGPEADLWALGVVLFQMMAGFTPFAATSPYLSFLRIKRAFLRRPAFASDNEWAVVQALLTKNPHARLANASGEKAAARFRSSSSIGGKEQRVAPSDIETKGNSSDGKSKAVCSIEAVQELHYDTLRAMPFFHEDRALLNLSEEGEGDGQAEKEKEKEKEEALIALKTLHTRPAIMNGTPREQARRVIARRAVTAAGKIADVGGIKNAIKEDSEDAWVRSFSLVVGGSITATDPSSDGGSVTSFVITDEDRAYMLHYLHRRNQLNVPGLYRLFWPTLVDSKCVRTDDTTMDYHSHSFKQHGSWPEKEAGQAFLFCHLVSPRVGSSMTSTDSGGDGGEAQMQEACKVELASLKSAVTSINRLRPKFVIVCGPFTDTVYGSQDHGQGGGVLYSAQTKLFRHNVCRVSDSISLLFVPSAHEMGLTSSGSSGSSGGNGRNLMPTIHAIRDYHSRYGLDFFGFWYRGVRCLIVNSSLFWVDAAPEGEGEGDGEAPVDVEVLAHARRQEQWLSEEIDISKLCSVQIMLFSYHQWYHRRADEDEDEDDLGVKLTPDEDEEESGSTTTKNIPSEAMVVPYPVRLKWMRRLQHAKVKAVVTFSSGNAGASVESCKRRQSAFPSAPVEARRLEQEKVERRRAKRAAKLQERKRPKEAKNEEREEPTDAATTATAGGGLGETPDSKRRDTKPTPGKSADTGATVDMVDAGGDPLRPSQVIAEAVKSGEVKAKNTHQAAQDGSFGHPAAMPPRPPTEVEEENTDDDSDNNYSTDDDTDEGGQESEGEEEERKDDREPGFANVDKTLAGPDQILTGGGAGGDLTKLRSLSAALFKVTEEKVKVMHLLPSNIPKEAPPKGWA